MRIFGVVLQGDNRRRWLQDSLRLVTVFYKAEKKKKKSCQAWKEKGPAKPFDSFSRWGVEGGGGQRGWERARRTRNLSLSGNRWPLVARISSNGSVLGIGILCVYILRILVHFPGLGWNEISTLKLLHKVALP